MGSSAGRVVYHSQMAAERQDEGSFTFETVAAAIADKMIRRHPHVFGDASVENAEAQTKAWEDVKAEKRRLKGKAEPESLLDNIPLALPCPHPRRKTAKNARARRLRWGQTSEVLAKIEEELGELKTEIDQGMPPDRIEDELGDLLFTVTIWPGT